MRGSLVIPTRFEIHDVKADLFNGARGGGGKYYCDSRETECTYAETESVFVTLI